MGLVHIDRTKVVVVHIETGLLHYVMHNKVLLLWTGIYCNCILLLSGKE